MTDMADPICVKFDGLTRTTSQPPPADAQTLLFNALRDTLSKLNFAGLPDQSGFSLTLAADLFDRPEQLQTALESPTNRSIVVMAAVAGMLLQSGIADPFGNAGAAAPTRLFVDGVTSAVGEFNTNPAHFLRVANYLLRTAAGPTESLVRPRELAEVTRRVIDDGRAVSDAYFDAYVQSALATVLGGGVDRRAVALEIKLPDLDDESGGDIIKDNVAASAAIYFTAMVEELKLFAVADRVAQEFVDGRIPVSKSRGGQAIFDYFKGAVNRLTESERRGLYARVFGVAQGNVEVQAPNREFNDLWIRFLSSVSLQQRQTAYIQVAKVTEQQVFKAARDLSVNLSLHGYGMVHFAAVEFQNHVAGVKAMLSYPDVVAAYGARDIWQLVERVSDMSLGGAVNGVRQRTLAKTGSDIILWLSRNAGRLSTNQFQGFLSPTTLTTEEKQLVQSVESWLAMTGTRDETVEQFSSPVEIRQQSTIPQLFSMPSMQGMQDALKNSMQQLGANGARFPQA